MSSALGSYELGPYDLARVTTDRFHSEGAPCGSLGYMIEKYSDEAFEVEISYSSTGATLALIVATPEEFERVDIPPSEVPGVS